MTSFLNQGREDNKIIEALNKFFDSGFYIILIMLVSILSWKLQTLWIMLTVVIILFIAIHLFKINKSRVFILIMFSIISLRGNNKVEVVIALIILTIIVVPVIIDYLITSKLEFNNPIMLAMVLVIITMMFSLVNAPNLIMPFEEILVSIMFLCLFFYVLTIKNNSGNNEDVRTYLSKGFIYLGLAILIEIFLYYFENREGNTFASFFGGENIHLSWGNANLVATVYLFIIPLTTFYFIKRQEMLKFIIFLGIDLFALILLLSRGAYLAFLISIIPLLILVVKDIKDKIKFFRILIFFIILVEISVILYFIPKGLIKGFFDILNIKGLSLEGRKLLFNIGFSVFGRYPLFGGGAGTAGFYLGIVSTEVFYHNYIIETLATIGSVGMVAFIYYIFQIGKYIIYKCDYNRYVLIVVLSLLVQGLFDTTFYNPIVMILLTMIVAMMNDEKNKVLSEVK